MIKRTDRRSSPQAPVAAVYQLMLDQAMALLQDGRLAKAEQLYTRVLRHLPRCFDALHLLGVIALQTGRLEKGAELIAKAIKGEGHLGPYTVMFVFFIVNFMARSLVSERDTGTLARLLVAPPLIHWPTELSMVEGQSVTPKPLAATQALRRP